MIPADCIKPQEAPIARRASPPVRIQLYWGNMVNHLAATPAEGFDGRTLFGIDLQDYTYIPVDVFPFDADNTFKRGRKWETTIVDFSPVLEQRFIVDANPLITYEIGLQVLKGDIQDPTSKAAILWNFFNEHRGRAVLFWFFDPVPWGFYPVPYNSDPTTRLHHPTDAHVGRYIALFDDDNMDSELFEYRLQRSQLKLSMFPG